MQDTKKECNRWLLQAQDDFRFVEWVLNEGVFFDKGCFIAQQAGEKALKACLYGSGKRHVLGHSLFELVQQLIQKDDVFCTIVEPAKKLDRFYIPTRYPNGLPGGSPFQLFNEKDLAEAYDDLKQIMEKVTSFIKTIKEGYS